MPDESRASALTFTLRRGERGEIVPVILEKDPLVLFFLSCKVGLGCKKPVYLSAALVRMEFRVQMGTLHMTEFLVIFAIMIGRVINVKTIFLHAYYLISFGNNKW